MGLFNKNKESIQVQGMSCEHCEKSVKEALEKLPGIKKAEADHKKGRVNVRYEAVNKPKRDALSRAIEEAGYQMQF
jgi:copper chaperone CopZ